MVAEVVLPLGMLEDRQHACNAGTAGDEQKVAGFLRLESGAPKWTEDTYLSPGGLILKQPVAKAPAGLLLDDEGDTPRGTLEVHHRIGSATPYPRNFEHCELA